MKKLYFIRHGLSEGNRDKIFVSGSSPLTDEGITQGLQTAEMLKEQGLRVDLIITSPMLRAHHTAKIIADKIDYPVEMIEINPILSERDFGKLVGSSTADFFASNSIEAIDEVEEVETIEQLQQRAREALDYIKSKDDVENILIVGHGAFGRALRRVVNGQPHTDEYAKSRQLIDNAEIIELI